MSADGKDGEMEEVGVDRRASFGDASFLKGCLIDEGRIAVAVGKIEVEKFGVQGRVEGLEGDDVRRKAVDTQDTIVRRRW
jgi:hypothetical protein